MVEDVVGTEAEIEDIGVSIKGISEVVKGVADIELVKEAGSAAGPGEAIVEVSF